MHFDDLLKTVGEFGFYQKTRLIPICFVCIVCAFHAMNMVFVGAKPEFWCDVPVVNVSGVIFSNTSSKELFLSEETCERYDENDVTELFLAGNVTFNDFSLRNFTKRMVKCDKWVYSKEVYGPTITSQFDLVCSNSWLRSTTKTLYFFGRLLGAVGFGQASDIFGRKTTLFMCLFMLLIAGSAASVAPNIYVFIPFYIIQGAAQTGLFLVAFTMGTELVGPSYRLFAGFLAQCFYSIGFMSLSGIAYAIKDWKYIELAITIPVVLFIPCFWFLPESVRWSLSKHKVKEAVTILRKVAKVNGKTISGDLLGDLSKIELTTETKNTRKFTVIDLCRPGIVLLSLNVWFNWFVISMVYYGLSLGTGDIGGDPYINFLIAGAVEIPANILCMLLLNPLGRKRPLFVSNAVGGIACIASGFIEHTTLKITLAMVGKFCINASYGIIYLMAAEVFPTVVRNIGMGVSSMCARVGGMLAPQILDLIQIWAPLPWIFFGGMSVFAGALALFLPETSGKPLPQTIDDLKNVKRSERI